MSSKPESTPILSTIFRTIGWIYVIVAASSLVFSLVGGFVQLKDTPYGVFSGIAAGVILAITIGLPGLIFIGLAQLLD